MLKWTALIIMLPVASFAGADDDVSAARTLSKGAYDYYCTGADGSRYELGEVVCLINNSCSASWLAKCDMSQNNPMWRKVQDGCPAAQATDLFDHTFPIAGAELLEKLHAFAGRRQS